MPDVVQRYITAAVEGDVDEAVLLRLAQHLGLFIHMVYGKQGKRFLRQHIRGFNEAARHAPWCVIVDLNHEAECPPALVQTWLPNAAPHMRFRVAVREIESWVMADRQRLASLLGVAVSTVPKNPEELEDPKAALVNIARRSRHRNILEEMVPRPGSGRDVGPAYTSRLIQFVADADSGWRPDVAAGLSDSLQRCMVRLSELATG